jgi:hypothetical protein
MPGNHGSGCGCQHEVAEPTPGGTQWLDQWIDLNNTESCNEEVPRSCANLFRPYTRRLEDPPLPCMLDREEDSDALLISVAFTCPVKMTGITLIGGADGRSPSKVDLYSNLISMESADEVTPSQTIDPLVEDLCGIVEYPLRAVKFSQVTRVVLRLTGQVGFEVNWIGFRGIASGDKRAAVVTVYESRANLADHEVKDDVSMSSRQIS